MGGKRSDLSGLAVSQAVDLAGNDDDSTGDHFLPVGIKAHLGAAIGNNSHDERADHRAQDAALTTGGAGTTDDDGGDDA